MPSPTISFHAAIRYGLIGLVILPAACTKRSHHQTGFYIGNRVILDSNRVLATVVRETEYDVDGFMISKMETEFLTRFFLLDIRDPSPPRPLKAVLSYGIDGRGFVDGDYAVLDPWKSVDLRNGTMVSSGFDIDAMRKPVKSEYVVRVTMGPGPGSGKYLISAIILLRAFPEREIGAWYVFDKASKGYELIASDSLGEVLDLAYHDGKAWVLYRKDSLTVVHRQVGSDSPGITIDLPERLTGSEASVEYLSAPDSLWLRFACTNCGAGGLLRYRYMGSGSDPWVGTERPYPGWLPLSVVGSETRKSIVLRRNSAPWDSCEFSLSDYLK